MEEGSREGVSAMIAKPQTLTAETEIFYPETDGLPLPDGRYQDPYFREIVSTIELHLKSDTTEVSGNTFIYYQEGNPQLRLSPDCFVSFNVNKAILDLHNSYRIWAVGKPPDFVLEIGSPSTATNDLGNKRDLYARLGFGEYWRFDPTGGEHYREALVGEYLEDGEYRRFEMRHEPDGTIWSHSPTLNLDLYWREGRLRFYDPVAGRWLQNMEEIEARAQSAEARATTEQARAETERTRAESAEARLAELKAELRHLRGE
jgi:Uma2 family endonuclease